MLGKLLKHELRATAYIMLPVMGGMLLLSALVNIFARFTDGKKLPAVLTVMVALVAVAFFVGIFSIGLITVIMMVRRFRDNLLRDEGYIMHTLPVSVHAQIWSKVIVSTLWYALSAVAMVLSLLVAAWDVNTLTMLRDLLSDLMQIRLSAREVELIAEVLGLLVLGSLLLSLSFDAALAVGHSFAKRKMALSVLTFIVLLILGEMVAYGASVLAGRLHALDYISGVDFIVGWRSTCAYLAAVMLFEGAACYLITVFFLKRKLNLE